MLKFIGIYDNNIMLLFKKEAKLLGIIIDENIK